MTEIQFFRLFNNEISQTADILMNNMKRNFIAQGHNNTGKFLASLDHQFKMVAGQFLLEYYGEDYGLDIDTGLTAGQIPNTTQYLQDLKEYFLGKGKSQYEAIKAAINTRRVQKRTGMPTPGSFLFSTNGKRTGFIKDSYSENQLYKEYQDAFFNVIDRHLQSEVAKLNSK